MISEALLYNKDTAPSYSPQNRCSSTPNPSTL
jgi:hypothetical protein